MQWSLLFAIGAGGAIGSVARHLVANTLQPATAQFPWGIFAVNVIGGFLMGVIVELSALKLNLSPDMRAFLTVGILGGFTTFSAFALDSALLIQRGAYLMAGLYITGSTILSIAALFAGLWLIRTFQ